MTDSYPGARRPDRHRVVDAWGLALCVHEWGPADGPPLLLAHGGFDFAGTFDTFAPLLADAGWRVVAWDQRGHGDSAYAALYSWDADVRDAGRVLDATTSDPVPVIGHSKGGGLMMRLAEVWPHRVRCLVNIDGLPSKRRIPDLADHQRTKLLVGELTGWLDHRRRSAEASRKPGTRDELAARRARMNPRLPMAWLRYLVGIGGREDADGWRWKIDPSLRMGGFGPWRPEWSLEWLPGLAAPMLGVLGTEQEEMGWGTTPDSVRPYLPPDARLEVVDGVGHFVHVERPVATAEMVIDFIGRP